MRGALSSPTASRVADPLATAGVANPLATPPDRAPFCAPIRGPYFPGLVCDSEVAVAATEGQDLDLVAVDGSVGPV